MTSDQAASATIVVVSAHAADFVWRAGGAIALYAERDHHVHVLCLTYGERGESQGLWKQEGMTLQRVKDVRHGEAVKAAGILGATISFLDADDYPLRATDSVNDSVTDVLRSLRPSVILTHADRDPYNYDHALTREIVMRSRMVAQAAGHDPGTPPLGAAQVLAFEPHQPEQCGFVPNLLLDISSVFERKLEAMQVMEGAQGHLVRYYTELGARRGAQAVRNGGQYGITQAEAYQRVFPIVGEELI
jgi:4-oxalomesaconate hydratase